MGLTNQHIFDAIAGLKADAIRMNDERKQDLIEVIAHLRALNGRTRKNENAITRLNLVVFGLGSPLALAGLGAAAKYLFG